MTRERDGQAEGGSVKPISALACALLGVVFLAGGICPRGAEAALQFEYNTGPCGFSGNDTLDVYLTVDDTVVDLRGFQVRLGFDPSVFTAVSVGLGDLVDGPECDFFPALMMATADSIAVDAAGLGCSVSGPGSILRIRLVGVGFGVDTLRCDVSTLRDSGNQPIPHSSPKTEIEYGPSRVPLALLPAEVSVQPGGSALLELTVPAACDSFNAYEVTIEHSPSLLTFMPHQQTAQEGELMKSACNNRFHDFSEANGVISLTHGLLCAGQKVTGPGVVYKFWFEAAASPGTTYVRITHARMADAGIALPLPQTSDARILIEDVTGLPPDNRTTDEYGFLFPAYPNPFRSDVRLSFTLVHRGRARLEIYSVSGRLVRQLLDQDVPAGDRRTVRWNGVDDRGRPAVPGLYWARLHTPYGVCSRRIIKIE